MYQHSVTPLALPCKLVLPACDPTESKLGDTDSSAITSQKLLRQGAGKYQGGERKKKGGKENILRFKNSVVLFRRSLQRDLLALNRRWVTHRPASCQEVCLHLLVTVWVGRPSPAPVGPLQSFTARHYYHRQWASCLLQVNMWMTFYKQCNN